MTDIKYKVISGEVSELYKLAGYNKGVWFNSEKDGLPANGFPVLIYEPDYYGIMMGYFTGTEFHCYFTDEERDILYLSPSQVKYWGLVPEPPEKLSQDNS